MKILNFGSLNIDKTYEVEDIVKEGETIISKKYEEFIGGKGLNQSISLARSGAELYHAGKIGSDGFVLLDALKKEGINTENVIKSDENSGHAIIQIGKNGTNSIIVYSGANSCISTDEIDNILQGFDSDDWLLLQNEISNLGYIISAAGDKGLNIALNASPVNENLLNISLSNIELLFINENEGKKLTGKKIVADIFSELLRRNKNLKIVLTLGKDGAIFKSAHNEKKIKSIAVDAVDTTGAGDTFTGYFLNYYINECDIDRCLIYATVASSLAVVKKGASTSIPKKNEVEKYIKSNQKIIDNLIVD